MTVLINASNTSGLTFSSDTSGSIGIQCNNTTIATISGTGANAGIQMGSTFAPAFFANAAGNQALTQNSWNKITLGNETYDTNNNFASSRFTPTIAGYYQFSGQVNFGAGSSPTDARVALYKNGSNFLSGNTYIASSANPCSLTVGGLIYLNGSTDYVELYAYTGTASVSSYGDATNTTLSGFLARSA